MTTTTFAKYAAIALMTGSLMACSSTPKPQLQPDAVQPQALEFTSTKRGPMVTLNDVLFDFEEATLRTEADSIVERAAQYLRENPERIAVIEGHTDHTGDHSYNQMLSDARSTSVRASLIEFGVSSDRIKTRGYGETRPVASNTTPDGRQANRRVEIFFQPAKDTVNRYTL